MAGLNAEELLLALQPACLPVAFVDALKAGDADGLLAFLTSPEGEAIPRTMVQWDLWCDPAVIAAVNKDTRCLRVLKDCGFVLSDGTWLEAAEQGALNCLAFAVSHGCELKDSVLEKAVCNGNLACVEFLLQQGLPAKPYLHSVYPARPEQLKCIQLMLDREVTVSPETLIVAAERGDLDFVRWLHQRGVPLWENTQDFRIWLARNPFRVLSPRNVRYHETCLPRRRDDVSIGALLIPWSPYDLQKMWKVLRYGAGHGAPINDRAKRFLEKKRQATHAVLLCVKAAARLCQGPGCAEQRRVWAGMAALPSALVEELLILADLEIPESVMRRPPL